jgi:hypothetical protein
MGKGLKVRQSITVAEAFAAMAKNRRDAGWTAQRLAEKLGCTSLAAVKALDLMVANEAAEQVEVWGQRVWKLKGKKLQANFRSALREQGEEEWLREYGRHLMSVMNLNYPRGPREGIPIIRHQEQRNEPEESQSHPHGAALGGDRSVGGPVDGAGDAVVAGHGVGPEAGWHEGLQARPPAKWTARAPLPV